jgi:hypothetical protein
VRRGEIHSGLPLGIGESNFFRFQRFKRHVGGLLDFLLEEDDLPQCSIGQCHFMIRLQPG